MRDAHDRKQLEEGLTLHYVPSRMHDAIRRYALDHQPVGGFLTAVLENDLHGALTRADTHNAICLTAWGHILYHYLPSQCWGSPAKVAEWLAHSTAEDV